MISEMPFDQITPEQITKGASAALGMITALYAGFKGRAEWEPHDQDIPSGSHRLAALAACVLIVLVTYAWGTPQFGGVIGAIALIGLILAIICYFSYQQLTTKHIYKIGRIVDGQSVRVNILGGAYPTSEAQKKINEGITVPELVDGCGGNLSQIWDNDSRSETRLKYEASYMGMIVGGTLSLASIGILFSWTFRA